VYEVSVGEECFDGQDWIWDGRCEDKEAAGVYIW
jgi:hypothetical protein